MELEELVATMPYAETLGIRLSRAAPEGVDGALEWTEDRCTAGGVLHGGVLMSLADSLGGVCAFLNLPAGASTATIESKTNFFRAVRSGSVRASTKPVHVGRTTIVLQTKVRDDNDNLVAMTMQTQAAIA